jgi:ribonuclease BN (tRNA processing enzyme)
MKVNFLGTCSGTEPIANFRHTSIALEYKGKVYWFDTGDNCAYSAHTGGKINILKTRAVFISHTHFDHTSGLPFLIASIHKIERKWNKKQILPVIDIFLPVPDELKHIIAILHYRKDRSLVNLEENFYQEGVIFEEDGIKVTTVPNRHIEPVDGIWSSYSFLIEADGKSVVYSGDIHDVKELKPLLNNPVDLIIMETGHHSAEEVCQYFVNSNHKFEKLAFTHHGRAILNDFDGEVEKCKKILGDKVFMCTDGMAYEV